MAYEQVTAASLDVNIVAIVMAVSWHCQRESRRHLLHQHLLHQHLSLKNKVCRNGFSHRQNWQLPQPSGLLNDTLQRRASLPQPLGEEVRAPQNLSSNAWCKRCSALCRMRPGEGAGSPCCTSQGSQGCQPLLEPRWISVPAVGGGCGTSWALGWRISASSWGMHRETFRLYSLE